MDGNEACAHMAYAFTEIAAIYPITPSSPVPQRGSPLPSRQRSGKTLFGQNRPYDGQSTRHRIQSKRLFRPGCYDCHVGRRENPSLSLFEARHKPDFIARRTNHLQSPPGNTGTQYCRRRTRDAMDRRVSDIPDGLVRPDRKDYRT